MTCADVVSWSVAQRLPEERKVFSPSGLEEVLRKLRRANLLFSDDRDFIEHHTRRWSKKDSKTRSLIKIISFIVSVQYPGHAEPIQIRLETYDGNVTNHGESFTKIKSLVGEETYRDYLCVLGRGNLVITKNKRSRYVEFYNVDRQPLFRPSNGEDYPPEKHFTYFIN